jgi:hypothetical protein
MFLYLYPSISVEKLYIVTALTTTSTGRGCQGCPEQALSRPTLGLKKKHAHDRRALLTIL